jgi:Rrf2 family transcriptional regulator, iron-sulfur cluster assembly transcription factor
MRMDLGRRADYAIRSTLDLARHPGRLRKARETAAEADVPERYLPQIMAALIRAGIVTSTAGREGGYQMARASADVSLLDVVEAVDGPIRSTECVLRGGACRWDGTCAVHDTWSAAQEAFREQFARSSFADLIANSEKVTKSSRGSDYRQ